MGNEDPAYPLAIPCADAGAHLVSREHGDLADEVEVRG
jgi:hypothetical protein